MDLNKLFILFLKEKQFLHNCTPKTIRYFESSFKAFSRYGLTELSKQNINETVITMRSSGKLSARSCNDYSKGMNSFFKWLHENEYVKELFKVPTMREEKKVMRAFSEEEMRRIMNWRPKSQAQVRLKTLVLTLMDTGCRIEELLTLTVDQLASENLLIKVVGKGRKERIIPMSLELRKIIVRCLREHEYELVFCTMEGSKLNYQNIWRDMQILLKRLHIEAEGFHCFRRKFSRQYLKAGGNFFYLQRVMGHSRLETTRIYLDADVEDLQKAHMKTSILSRLK